MEVREGRWGEEARWGGGEKREYWETSWKGQELGDVEG